jgi:hypothetical protein
VQVFFPGAEREVFGRRIYLHDDDADRERLGEIAPVCRSAAIPKRWIVERTLAWLNRCRRGARDWENLNRKALAFLKLASSRLMLRSYGILPEGLARPYRPGRDNKYSYCRAHLNARYRYSKLRFKQ